MVTIKEVKEQEKKLAEMRQSIKEQFKNKINTAQIKGVEKIGHNIVTVKFSTLKNEDKWNAEYFITEIQTAEINKRLENCTSLDEIQKFLIKCIEQKYISKTNKNDKVYLHSDVLEVIQDVLHNFD